VCSKTLTSQELLKLIAQDIMIGVSDSVVHFFNSEMDEPVIYDDEWFYKGNRLSGITRSNLIIVLTPSIFCSIK